MKYAILTLAMFLGSVHCMADNARFTVRVVDERTELPISGVKIKAVFTDHTLNWENATIDHEVDGKTDDKGLCPVSGNTNCGEAGFRIRENDGFYCTSFVKVPFGLNGGRPIPFIQWWEPNNQIITVALQRVEHPTPLFVKYVELRDFKNGIGGFDGTNSVLRYDLMKGEWLPPYGNGEVVDLLIDSKLTILDRERKFRYATKKVEDVLFYELSNAIDFGGQDDFVRQLDAGKMAGIKIREAAEFNPGNRVIKAMGMRKVIAKNKNWHCEYYSDKDTDRCYTFRIRSRRDEKGKLVEAYYGKIYGDFEFEGDDKKGLIGVKFLYYLNPKSLDRNLEWDMKHNLCPNGNVGLRQP